MRLGNVFVISTTAFLALSSSASAASLGLDFVNSVRGQPGAPKIPTYTPLAPGVFEVLDRVGPAYSNGYPAQTGTAGNELPADSPVQARALSNALSTDDNQKVDAVPLSNLAVAMFQLLASHEIARSPTNSAEPSPIALQPGDEAHFGNLNPLSMDRSQTTGSLPRQQLNDVTSAFDGSTVYGSTDARKQLLWETDPGTGAPTGFLLTDKTDAVSEPRDGDPSVLPGLPKIEIPRGSTTVLRPIAGDVRADENPTLEALHQLFVLEHNRIAQIITDDCATAGTTCSGEQVFNAARYLVAETQKKIFYDELLPVFLGTDDLESLLPDPTVLNSVEGAINEFTAAAGRVGHTQVPDTIRLATRDAGKTGEVTLSECFFDRNCLGSATLEEILYGAASQKAEAIDPKVEASLRNGQSPAFGATRNIDLLATNINRGRDHGIPGYLDTREALGFAPITTLEELRALLPDAVLEAYGITSAEDILTIPIDLLVGLFGENRDYSEYLGETGKALWALQFLALDKGTPPVLLASAEPGFQPANLAMSPGSRFLAGQTMEAVLVNNLGGSAESFRNPFIAPIPLPPALLTLGGALAGLVLIRRRKSRQTA